MKIDENEIAYLLKVYNDHFKKQLGRDDIVWTYSGVRPLCDDESDSPQAITAITRWTCTMSRAKAPLLSVFGGKLTTYRKLAEHAMEKLAHYTPGCGPAWTKTPRCRAVTSTATATATRPNCAVRTAGCRKLRAPLCPHLRQPERADPGRRQRPRRSGRRFRPRSV